MADRKAPSERPIWALALACLALIGWGVLLTHWMAGAIEAFALGTPDAGWRMGAPLAGGALAAILIVWTSLAAAFRRRWNARSDYFALFVLLSAALWSTGVGVVVKVHQVRQAQAQAFADAAARQKNAILGVAGGFADKDDAALVTRRLRVLAYYTEGLDRLRDMKISRTEANPDAVCGQFAKASGAWAGFVSSDRGVFVERDGFDAARRRACLPLIDKYVGVDLKDAAAAVAEIRSAGCADLDVSYWEAEKAYCRGEITTPVTP